MHRKLFYVIAGLNVLLGIGFVGNIIDNELMTALVSLVLFIIAGYVSFSFYHKRPFFKVLTISFGVLLFVVSRLYNYTNIGAIDYMIVGLSAYYEKVD